MDTNIDVSYLSNNDVEMNDLYIFACRKHRSQYAQENWVYTFWHQPPFLAGGKCARKQIGAFLDGGRVWLVLGGRGYSPAGSR